MTSDIKLTGWPGTLLEVLGDLVEIEEQEAGLLLRRLLESGRFRDMMAVSVWLCGFCWCCGLLEVAAAEDAGMIELGIC
jgi:hypothetical protein